MKNENTTPATTTNPKAASTAAMMPQFRPAEPPATILENEVELRRWERDQRKIEADRRAAWGKYPPGTKLHVTTARGIPRRSRAGLAFSAASRTLVEVVNYDDDTIAKVKAAPIVTPEDQDRVSSEHNLAKGELSKIRSGNVVSPVGAKAIAEDDGLTVHQDAGASSEELQAAAEELENERRENAKLRKELDALRARRNADNPAAPTRLTGKDKGDDKGASSSSEDFGGDTKVDPKAKA